MNCYSTGRHQEAIRARRKAAQVEAKSSIALVFLRAVYSMAGHEEEARIEAAEVIGNGVLEYNIS
jgi:hypothetical protein